jgi:lipopolysaccharide export system protein LptA
VAFSRSRTTAKGVGVTYNKTLDVLTILDQAEVHMQPEEQGGDGVDIVAGTAEFNRGEHIVNFGRSMKAVRTSETVEAASAVAHLSEDENRIEALDLRGGARVTGTRSAPGTFKSLAGREVDLKYASDGRTIQSAVIRESAVIELSAEPGQSERQISAETIDLTLAGDGSVLTRIVAREKVQLAMPADQAAPGAKGPQGTQGTTSRTITAGAMDGTGNDRQGITGARFTGNVEFRERGRDVSRTVRSAVLDVTTPGGLATIEEARFSQAVKFEAESMNATSAAARYLLNTGALELRGGDAGAAGPRMWNERMDIQGQRIDVVLEGPVVKASGDVRSTLRPVTKPAPGSGKPDPKVPSMLKKDQAVSVTANDLTYDGTASKATYTTNAVLWQGETKIRGTTIVIDDTSGDLTASGGVSTTSLLLQGGGADKDKKKERVLSRGSAKDFRYEESERRATYTGEARLVDPQGDLNATKIELYLTDSGDEVEHAEAHEHVVLLENGRKTTGDELKYFSAEERYDMKGRLIHHVDACKRESTALTLTLFRGSSKVIATGGPQNLTSTKADGAPCP